MEDVAATRLEAKHAKLLGILRLPLAPTAAKLSIPLVHTRAGAEDVSDLEEVHGEHAAEVCQSPGIDHGFAQELQ